MGSWLLRLSLRSKGGMRWVLVPRDEDAPPFGTEQRDFQSITLPILAGCTETLGRVCRPPPGRQSPVSPAKATVWVVGWTTSCRSVILAACEC